MRCKYTVCIGVLRTDDSILGLLAHRRRRKALFLRFIDHASGYIRVIKTNLMLYLSSVYFVSQPPHVLSIFVVHHKEVYCTRSVRKVSDRIFLCEHLMDYNLACLHEPTLNLSAHA